MYSIIDGIDRIIVEKIGEVHSGLPFFQTETESIPKRLKVPVPFSTLPAHVRQQPHHK